MELSDDHFSALSAPPTQYLGQSQQYAPDLDRQFGNMLCSLMSNELTAADAINQLQEQTGQLVQYYRAEAGDELAPAARRINLSKMSAELEGQAASWQLLQALYCSADDPAGTYEGAHNVGDRLTLRQRLADVANGDNTLKRFAQVVMWLESLASQKLPQDSVQLGASFRFGSQEGVWKDTLRGLGGHSRAVTDTEMDPDSVSRDQLKLARGDQGNEQRLAHWVWRLVRAGRFKEACELCANAGQSWRAVSMSGAGPWGPLPVGEAAMKASLPAAKGGDLQDPSEEVACEVEGGAATARLQWKWACCAAAAAAGPSDEGEGGNKFEAALYGALCGDVKAMLPACDSWEDEAWAYCRAWLELQVDAEVLQPCTNTNPDPTAQAAAQELYLGQAGDNSEAEIPLDLLEGFVDLAASTGYSRSTNKQLLREGLAVMNGDWPLQRLALGNNEVLVPSNFKELYDLLCSSSNNTVASAAKQDQHRLQVQLMADAWTDAVSQLTETTRRAQTELEVALQQQDTVMGPAGFGDGGASAGAALDVLRFNAHMALALRALGLLQDPLTTTWADTELLRTLQLACSRIISAYASHLACQSNTLDLVPAFLCHLRLPERRGLATTMLNTALQSGLDDANAEYLCSQLFSGTAFWYDQQLKMLAGEGPAVHGLYGDLRAEEARLLLQYHVYKTFSSTDSTPKERCDTLRWMLYGFIAAERHQEQQQQLAWQGCWADAISNSLGLATQLALNPGFGGPALTYLLQDVVPQEFAAGARQAALQAIGLGPDADTAGAGGVDESSVSQAAGVDVVQPAGQLQVQRQLLALLFWQHYADVEGRYQAWKQSRSALLQAAVADGMPPPAYTMDDAVALVQDMLHLAQQDALRLPAPQWLVEAVSSMRGSASEAAAAGLPDRLSEGDWLSLPQFDAALSPQVLAAEADGIVEQVLGMLPYYTVQIAVTVSRHQPGRTGLQEAAEAQDMELPYRALQYAELSMLKERVHAFLTAATAASSDVSFQVDVADNQDDAVQNCLLIQLQCYHRQRTYSSSSSSRELDSRELQAWRDMVSVAVALVDAGSKRGTVGGNGNGNGYGEEDGPGVPRVCVAYIDSSHSTQLAISRRRTTSKLLRRSAKVLSVLTRQGYRGPELDALLACASQGDDSEGLLSQLSQGDAAALLDTLTEVLAEVMNGAAY